MIANVNANIRVAILAINHLLKKEANLRKFEGPPVYSDLTKS